MYFDVGFPFRSNRDATSNPKKSSHRFDFTMNHSRPREESIEGILSVSVVLDNDGLSTQNGSMGLAYLPT